MLFLFTVISDGKHVKGLNKSINKSFFNIYQKMSMNMTAGCGACGSMTGGGKRKKSRPRTLRRTFRRTLSRGGCGCMNKGGKKIIGGFTIHKTVKTNTRSRPSSLRKKRNITKSRIQTGGYFGGNPPFETSTHSFGENYAPFNNTGGLVNPVNARLNGGSLSLSNSKGYSGPGHPNPPLI